MSNNQPSNEMLAGLAGLAAYDNMKHHTPQNNNAKVIVLDQTKNQLVESDKNDNVEVQLNKK